MTEMNIPLAMTPMLLAAGFVTHPADKNLFENESTHYSLDFNKENGIGGHWWLAVTWNEVLLAEVRIVNIQFVAQFLSLYGIILMNKGLDVGTWGQGDNS